METPPGKRPETTADPMKAAPIEAIPKRVASMASMDPTGPPEDGPDPYALAERLAIQGD